MRRCRKSAFLFVYMVERIATAPLGLCGAVCLVFEVAPVAPAHAR